VRLAPASVLHMCMWRAGSATVTEHGANETEPGHTLDATHVTDEEKPAGKFGMLEACALNTLNMFGTGPFITIPFLFATTDPYGPQWLIGYALAAFICVNDSFIWAELSSMMPQSGGSYSYLRECYGRNTFGRLMAWLFVWQFFLSAPLEIASGFVAMSQYLAYVTKVERDIYQSFIAVGFCLMSLKVLWLNTESAGKMTTFLWGGTVAAIAFVIVAGFINFDSGNLAMPEDPFQSNFVLGLGMAARIGIYDFTGYFDICQMGHEVENPRKTLPYSCVSTCVVVAIIYFLVYIAVAGFLPWTFFVTLVDVEDDSANYIMSIFAEELWGGGFAIFFTFVVLFTIFGSCFALMIGYAHVPYAAAKDGFFLAWFGKEHPTRQGLPARSLAVIGICSAACCLVDLEVLIEGMLTTRLLLQFIAQAVAVIIYRFSHPEVERQFRVPLYPLPNLICILGFFFVFVTTDNWVVNGDAPLLELGVLFPFVGALCYFPWASALGHWPFQRSKGRPAVEENVADPVVPPGKLVTNDTDNRQNDTPEENNNVVAFDEDEHKMQGPQDSSGSV